MYWIYNILKNHNWDKDSNPRWNIIIIMKIKNVVKIYSFIKFIFVMKIHHFDINSSLWWRFIIWYKFTFVIKNWSMRWTFFMVLKIQHFDQNWSLITNVMNGCYSMETHNCDENISLRQNCIYVFMINYLDKKSKLQKILGIVRKRLRFINVRIVYEDSLKNK